MTFLILMFSLFSIDSLIYLALAALLGLQLWLVLRLTSLPKKRLRIRLGLNILLWLVVLLFIIQPEWHYTTDTNRILLTSSGIPSASVQHIKDSLGIKESFDSKDFSRRVLKDPHFIDHLGNIYLMGQEFSPVLLSKLSQKKLIRVPFFKVDELQDIHWKSILSKGDIQEIRGKIEVSEDKVLRIKYADQVLDSAVLKKGFNAFQLRFPIFSIGRTETELELNNQSLQSVRFYTRNVKPLHIRFILENPDFESKTLSEWLGKNNNYVEVVTTIAKNSQSKVSINQATKSKMAVADIVITDPSNAGHSLVKGALAEGKSVLFINVTNPEQALKGINQTLGANWRVKKVSNEEHIALSENLTALPYRFEEHPYQKILADYPIAVQKKVGKIGVSLLNETFPLKLNGDSLAYGKIWAGVLQQLTPSYEDNVAIDAPVFADVATSIKFNNLSIPAKELSISGDTSQLLASAINPLSATSSYIFRKTGWQPLQDSLEIYVEEKPGMLSQDKQLEEVLMAHENYAVNSLASSAQTLSATLPDWAWFLLILLSLTALWVEPKLDF